MQSGRIDIMARSGGGRFGAYLSSPVGAPRGAIVVLQEIFGINAGIRAKCDLLAEDGYLAIAPDLFWRSAPWIELDPDDAAERERAFTLIRELDLNLAVEDLEATIREARRRVDGKVGVVGYCFGGRLAFLAATRTDVDASAGYYGGGIDTLLGERHAIARPLLLHFAGDDAHITPDKVSVIRDALADDAKVTIHVYPGADHGFATEFGARRQEAPAREADARTRDFFREHVG